MSPLFIVLAIVYIVLCIGLIAMILMQKKRQAGLGGGLAGMSQGGGSFYDKNKKNTLEGQLEKYTKIGGALFFAFSMLLGLLA